ncbi:hypothetical protein V3W47_19440 [Deinococcus sp. YIM 134068]|uniref:hypothetical protein n=1 Tax=Deinococcus lichenicola TaxID=3118910 RepID=UPI002F94275E
MGEAKRRQELGHMLRRNTYTFTVAPGPQIQHLGPLPVDEDDERGIRHAVELYGPDTEDWEEAMVSIFEFHDLDEPPSTPTHIRCELLVERIRKGGSVFYNSLFPKELAYSLDGGQTWHDLPPQPRIEDEPGTGAPIGETPTLR